MNELNLVEANGVFYADSREVAEMVEKRHDNLLRDIEGYIRVLATSSTLRASDFFVESHYVDGKKEKRRSYLITRRGCDMVANKMIGDKGILFTATYVSRFEEMEKRLAAPVIPQTLPEALRLAADLAEKNGQLLLQAEADRPKVLFADSVSASQTSILVGDLAKILKQNGIKIGPNRLFSWLRENGYLIRRKGADYNTPTQRSMEMRLFEIKETSITHSDGHITVGKTSKVTGRGQIYFINKFKEGQYASS